MIPKKIHFCWFGGKEKTDLAKKCIESWKKYCPDYEIIEWNEQTFDINSNLYVKQAYENKKWAFVTDYVRLYALYNQGGLYMDTDVEVVKSLDELLKHRAFSGFQAEDQFPTGIMASEKESPWIYELLKEYDELEFEKDGKLDLTTNVDRITNKTVELYSLELNNKFQELGDGELTVYPLDYFCAKSLKTGIVEKTKNTYTIHHFAGSWLPPIEIEKKKYRDKYVKKFGPKLGVFVTRIVFYIKHPVVLVKKVIKK